MSVPTIKLNDGNVIPTLGLGTWQGAPGKEAEVGDAVKVAINLGYRHIDCAHVYQNERIIGESIAEKIKEGSIKREDLFIVSKLWCTHHDPDRVEEAIRATLKNLKLEYLDLYLIHWPHAFKYGNNPWPTDPTTGELLLDFESDYLSTWRAMEKLLDKGLTKSIGVSNFNSIQLDRLIKNGKIVPAVNQVECHPYLNQEKLRNFCKEKGIVVVAYSPLGSASRPWKQPGDPDVIDDAEIKKIADKYGKTPGQILLRYQIQIGNVAIPKSSNPERLHQNINIFDFELTNEDMLYIGTFNREDGRICPGGDAKTHPHYPFKPEIEF